MKSLLAFGLPLVIAVASGPLASAQSGSQVNALGGVFASRGMGRPLGGVTPAFPQRGPNQQHGARPNRGGAVLPFGYSVYVPNYFDSFGFDPYPASAEPGPYAPYQAPQGGPPAPPVIINQYFTTGPQSSQQTPPQQTPAEQPPEQQPAAGAANHKPGDPIGTPDNFYLIAFKNHTVYTALAYWVEDTTFHYVTTQNTHNQASLSLIDLALTKQLNLSRDVPFSIAGQ